MITTDFHSVYSFTPECLSIIWWSPLLPPIGGSNWIAKAILTQDCRPWENYVRCALGRILGASLAAAPAKLTVIGIALYKLLKNSFWTKNKAIPDKSSAGCAPRRILLVLFWFWRLSSKSEQTAISVNLAAAAAKLTEMAAKMRPKAHLG